MTKESVRLESDLEVQSRDKYNERSAIGEKKTSKITIEQNLRRDSQQTTSFIVSLAKLNPKARMNIVGFK